MNLLAGLLGVIVGLGIFAIGWGISMTVDLWKDVVTGFAEVGGLVLYAAILFPVIIAISAALCVPIVRGINGKAKLHGFDSIKDYLTHKEMSGLKKSCLIGFIGVIIFINILANI